MQVMVVMGWQVPWCRTCQGSSGISPPLPTMGNGENKKGPDLAIWPLFFHMVRLAGIEPTTPWFVAKYSIQLSYSRERQDYSSAFTKRQARTARHVGVRRRAKQGTPRQKKT